MLSDYKIDPKPELKGNFLFTNDKTFADFKHLKCLKCHETLDYPFYFCQIPKKTFTKVSYYCEDCNKRLPDTQLCGVHPFDVIKAEQHIHFKIMNIHVEK